MERKFICKQCEREFKDNRGHKNRQFCSVNCKVEFRRGKTWEELFGEDRAEKMKIFSEEHKKRISKGISLVQEGVSWEERMGIVKANKKKGEARKRFSGKGNPFYNKTHNPKSIQKMRLAKLGKTHEEIMGKEKLIERNKKFSEKMSGENHHNWKGGYCVKDYKNFTLKFKNLIRKRDNQICMMCGKHREKLNKSLDVHHINYNKYLTIPQNCISLCASCHGKTHFNREHWISFFQGVLKQRYGYSYENKEIIMEVNTNENIGEN
jgi:hypothetical protein